MSELHTRKEKRTPVTLKIKFKSATLDQFIERYSVDVSHGGIFIRTKDPLAVGTQLRFEFQLQDASPLISGDGTVVWTREFDPSRVGVAPGMGVRFDRLAPESQPVLDQILTRKTGGRSAESSFEPASSSSSNLSSSGSNNPVTGEKTRITPPNLASSLVAASSRPVTEKGVGPLRTTGTLAPLAKSLFGVDEQKDNTPLPKPMPFHVAAEDEFNEDVFEQPTKVASIDSLIKHEEEHARAAAVAAAAAARAPAHEPEEEQTNVSRRPAVGQRPRSAPPPAAAPPRVTEPPLGSVPLDSLDDLTPMAQPRVDPRAPTMPPQVAPVTIPPAQARAASEPAVPVAPPPAANLVPPRAGSEPRFLENLRNSPAAPPSELAVSAPTRPRGSGPAATPVAPAPPPRAKSSSTMPLVLATGALLVGAAAVYWFVIRPMDEPPAAPPPRRPPVAVAHEPSPPPPRPSPPPPRPTPPPTAAAVKPADTAPPAPKPAEPVAMPPKVAPVDYVVETRPEKAEISLAGGSPMPSPATLKLEPGKGHAVMVTAPCFKDETVTVEPKAAGVNKSVIKLKPLERVVRVATDPAGANVFVDNRLEGKSPLDVKLVGRLDARNAHVFAVRKAGFQEAITRVLPDAPCATDGDLGVVGLSLTLAPMAVRKPAPPQPAAVRKPAARPVAAPAPKPPEPKPEPVETKPEPVETKPEPTAAKPEEPKPVDPPLPTKPEETKPEPKPESKPVVAEPKPEPAAPKPEAKPEQKDCDPSPDAPEWARCK